LTAITIALPEAIKQNQCTPAAFFRTTRTSCCGLLKPFQGCCCESCDLGGASEANAIFVRSMCLPTECYGVPLLSDFAPSPVNHENAAAAPTFSSCFPTKLHRFRCASSSSPSPVTLFFLVMRIAATEPHSLRGVPSLLWPFPASSIPHHCNHCPRRPEITRRLPTSNHLQDLHFLPLFGLTAL